jgi:predicted alpha/beta superfamily hydrolase
MRPSDPRLLPTLLCLLPLLTTACGREAPPVPAEGSPVVVGTAVPLASAVYDGTRTVVVRLPAGYEEGEAAYPVLYVVDGGARQDFVPMAGLAELATLSGQYRPFILVGVQTENRYHELTVRSDVAADLEVNPDCGGAAAFRRHLQEEVKPFVEGRYRTTGEDAVIGESLAGLFITETFLREPHTFSHYMAVSPSLWWRDMGLAREAAGLLQASWFPADRSLYLTVADEGGAMQEGVDRLVNALAAHAPSGTVWWYDPMPDEQHHTIYHPAALRALRLVFPPER